MRKRNLRVNTRYPLPNIVEHFASVISLSGIVHPAMHLHNHPDIYSLYSDALPLRRDSDFVVNDIRKAVNKFEQESETTV